MSQIKIIIFACLLIAMFATLAFAQQQCICGRNYFPVCGSNGVTYSNECNLNCQANTNFGRSIGLKVAFVGQCDGWFYNHQ